MNLSYTYMQLKSSHIVYLLQYCLFYSVVHKNVTLWFLYNERIVKGNLTKSQPAYAHHISGETLILPCQVSF